MAFDLRLMMIFNAIWVLLLICTLGFLIAGAGWWTLLLFPGGMVAVGAVKGALAGWAYRLKRRRFTLGRDDQGSDNQH
jgi:hypothetical protein